MTSTMTDYRRQADSGDLWIDPRIAVSAHRATTEWIDTLNQMAKDADGCAHVEGFPEFRDAQQLAEKFVKLANGDTGLRIRLTQFIDVANDLAELFRLSIAKFADTDLAFADYLTSLENPHTSIKDVGHGLTSTR